MLGLGIVKEEKLYLQRVGLGNMASTGTVHLEMSKYILIMGWDVYYESGVHRLLQKQGRVLPNRDWNIEAIGIFFFFYKGSCAT